MSNTLARITRSTIDLSGSSAFCLLSGILATLRHKISDKFPTAATNGITVWWNEEFVSPMDHRKISFVLAHEAAHSFFMHNATGVRLMKMDPRRAALAADHVVNNFLMDCDPDWQVIEPPTHVPPILDRKYQGWDIFRVFEDLKDKMPPSYSFDDHTGEGESMSEEDVKLIEEAIEAGKRDAARRAGGQSREYEHTQDRRNWRAMLVSWLLGTRNGKDQTTWVRPNRRHIHTGVYLPSRTAGSLRKAAFFIDTSGSIQDEELSNAIAAVKAMVNQLGCDELHLIYWDVGVSSHEVYRNATTQQLNRTKPSGGDGTSFEPVLAYLEKHKIHVDVGICVTDGFISGWGDKPQWPMLWLMTTQEKAPWGNTLKM